MCYITSSGPDRQSGTLATLSESPVSQSFSSYLQGEQQRAKENKPELQRCKRDSVTETDALLTAASTLKGIHETFRILLANKKFILSTAHNYIWFIVEQAWHFYVGD